MLISKNLKRIRNQKNLSQVGLANKSGMSRLCIGEIEKGKVSPRVDTIEKIAAALGVDPVELYSGQGEEKKDRWQDLSEAIRTIQRSSPDRACIILLPA